MNWVFSKQTFREFLLYAVNGATTALLYAGISAALVLFSPFNVGLIVLISQLVASTFHFLGSHYVFSKPIKSIRGGRLLKYSLAVLLNWTLSIICGVLLARLLGSELLGALLAPIIPTIINYPVLKFFVFRKV